MKRWVKQHITFKFEFDINILSSEFDYITGSTDLTDTDYDSFIISMIALFKSRDYTLSKDEEYTHESNRLISLSEYFTFTKWEGDIQIIVVVNVRISDHPDNPKRGLSAEEKRAKYVAKIGKEIADKYNSANLVSKPLDIIFDDKHLKSYTSAQLKLNSELNNIDKEVKEAIQDQT